MSEQLSPALISSADLAFRAIIEQLMVTPLQGVENIGSLDGNQVIVFYSRSGAPIKLEVLTDSMSPEERNDFECDVESLGEAITSFRSIDAGSARTARTLRRILHDLFGAVLPLSTPIDEIEDEVHNRTVEPTMVPPADTDNQTVNGSNGSAQHEEPPADPADTPAEEPSDEQRPHNPFAPPEFTDEGLPMTKAQKREWRRKRLQQMRS